jgi:hypothetical protein
MNPENLINWGELSRLLCGTRSVFTKKRGWQKGTQKHYEAINALIETLKKWYADYVAENKA